ncbi:MAG: DNA mismatch repair protein MutS, partial [Firmicutes bacterium]|nr:DNA mismatch repair protein MutS [Bacillota bacterium]
MEYTPMLRQYLQIKQNYQDAILFFRLGDFYEMFFEDAEVASRELEIVLTARDGGKGIKVPMCGVPHHAAESYLVRLIEKNYKVAVCEQVELPGESKGIVRREVTRVVTPGTIMAGQALEDKTHNYLIAVVPVDDVIGMACTDVTTGHFMVTSFSGSSANESLFDELIRLRPKEVLIPRKDILKGLENKEFLVTIIESRTCELSRAKRILYRHYGERWKVTGINHCTGMICAAGALLTYLYDTQKHELAQIRDINIYSTGHFMMLDAVTRRNLEITESIIDGGRQGTLFSVLDHSCTAMGARMLRGWLEQPLMDLTEINRRLDGVEALNKNIFLRESLRKLLVPVYDLERLGGRVAAGAANPKDMVCLRQSLALIPQIKELLINEETEYLKDIAVQMDILGDIYQLLDKAIVDQPPLLLREGGIIKPGYSEEIDRLRQASTDYKAWLAEMETAEKQRTGIKSLKIGYNKVFGYYIEITRSNLDQVPDDYIRKQTLVNAERFI